MRILIAGAWRHPIYEAAAAGALGGLGHCVIAHRWQGRFAGRLGRVQAALPVPGPALFALNAALARAAAEARPDVILLWRPTHLLPATIDRMRAETGATIVSYNNDDPFGPGAHGRAPWHHHALWYWYRRTLPAVDLALVYRPVNRTEALRAGARRSAVLKPWYIPALHRPLPADEPDPGRFACDAVFVGHYEPDGRARHLAALVGAGVHVRLFGTGWPADEAAHICPDAEEVRPVRGLDYARALGGARLGLAFLSRLNRDTYTRRCFEIPACGTLLLCERTDDLRALLEEDREAVFFSSPAELVKKARWLLNRPDEVARIAAAGRRRVIRDGHSVEERMAEMLDLIEHAQARAAQ